MELSLQTIAEGIEDSAQLERLVELGCDIGQGYLLGRPTDAARIAEMIVRREEVLPLRASA